MRNQSQFILNTVGRRAFDFITKHVHLNPRTAVLTTNTMINVESVLPADELINLKRINEFKDINAYFREVNKKLPYGGLFVNYVETYSVRKHRILKKYPKPFNWIYYCLVFFLTRITPKLKMTSKLYYYLSGGKGRVLSGTEILGRLLYCGFQILEKAEINNQMYFVAEKVQEPQFVVHNPNYGFLIKLPRVAKDGKVINVYKFRTMHAYSEYIQDYVYQQNDLAKGGKLNNDFRISSLGAFFRKYWLDELPMFINLCKGEIKIVGVRPLSKHYMSLYNNDLKKLRTLSKPGLLPPFYADMPETIDEIQASEERYLKAYLKSPFKTDVRYFFKIIHTIVIRGKRSA